MSPIDQPAIPKGSTVLITGANGFIGSHIADQFLKYGYKVRGTTRDPKKNAWIQNLFDRKYGNGQFDLAAVADMEAEDAFNEVVKGNFGQLRPFPSRGIAQADWTNVRRGRCFRGRPHGDKLLDEPQPA